MAAREKMPVDVNCSLVEMAMQRELEKSDSTKFFVSNVKTLGWGSAASRFVPALVAHEAVLTALLRVSPNGVITSGTMLKAVEALKARSILQETLDASMYAKCLRMSLSKLRDATAEGVFRKMIARASTVEIRSLITMLKLVDYKDRRTAFLEKYKLEIDAVAKGHEDSAAPVTPQAKPQSLQLALTNSPWPVFDSDEIFQTPRPDSPAPRAIIF
jgi:hypothetical protein